MKLVMVSETSSVGSGYTHISINIAKEIVRRGHELTVLGIGYKREPHPFPFAICPIDQSDWVRQVFVFLNNMKQVGYEHVLVGLDVPQLRLVLDQCRDIPAPFSGIFPIEATPISRATTMTLMRLKNRFVISKFGTEAVRDQKIDADCLVIPVDTDAWKTPTLEEKKQLRASFGFKESDKIVLTVADNQERKNLSASMEIISRMPEDVQYVLVTRMDSPVGWDLSALAEHYGIERRTMLLHRDLPFQRLWALYAIADAFLITSKAEGLGIPVLEAMSVGVPVVAPKHTAFAEHLIDGRGYLFQNAYQYIDPFENQHRYFTDVDEGVLALHTALYLRSEKQIALAREYVAKRSWENVGEVICNRLTS